VNNPPLTAAVPTGRILFLWIMPELRSGASLDPPLPPSLVSGRLSPSL
jgi:hypothetical protein